MRRNELRAETLFQNPDLTLEAVDPYLECGQLGLELLFRQSLLDAFEPSLDLVEPLLNPVEPLLDSLQAGDQHVVLSLEPIEALVDGVEVPVDVVEAGVDSPFQRVYCLAHYTLDVGQDDLAVESRQDRQEVFGHGPYPTPGPAPSGPENRVRIRAC